jgi:SAM-dependent methyltransferase
VSPAFDAYAAYYDLLYRDKDYAKEADFVATLVRSYASDARRLLELGCGTGGHAFELQRLGFEVAGIDASPAMIELARARAAASVAVQAAPAPRFEVADLRDYRQARSSDAVISLFHVFSYLTSGRDLARAFSAARANLSDGGVLVFDCWHGPGVMNCPPSSRTRTFSGSDVAVSRTSTAMHRAAEHRVDVKFDIVVTRGDEESRLAELHEMRYWFIPEIEACLRDAGLQLIASHGWMKQEPPTSDDWYACHVAQRAS